MRHLLLCLLLAGPRLALANDIERRCRESNFTAPGPNGERSAYVDIAYKDVRIMNFLNALKKEQNKNKAEVEMQYCRLLEPYGERSEHINGLRTVMMYYDYFDDSLNDFVRRGLKVVYNETLENGRLERRVEAFADCKTMEACIRIGIFPRAPLRRQKTGNEPQLSDTPSTGWEPARRELPPPPPAAAPNDRTLLNVPQTQ